MNTIAYFDTSHEMPEEVIMAAGYIPYKILGNIHVPNDSADQYLPNFFCPAAKSWLTEALSNSSRWEGIIFAQGCNTTNRHIDVWRMHVDTPFLYWYNNPMKDDEVAARFMKMELKKMIAILNQQYGTTIDENKLQQAIKVSNEIKEKLRALASMRSVKDIRNSEYLAIILKAFQLPKEEVLEELEKAKTEWSGRDEFPGGKKRILLTGSDITYTELMDTLDECNVRVVRDDLTTGERYFAHQIPEMEDPLDSIVSYYLNIPKPATKPGIQKRIDYLLSILSETEVDGILSQNLKFCEPFAYDSVTVNNTLKEQGHKLIHIEREFTPVADHQLMNRLMAFTETL